MIRGNSVAVAANGSVYVSGITDVEGGITTCSCGSTLPLARSSG